MKPYRVLTVQSHPIQYNAPLFQRMAQEPKLDLTVAYCCLQGAERGKDPEFGIEVAWDIPLLEGYSWRLIPNVAPRPGLGRFLGLVNPGLWQLIRHGGFDVVHVNGYAYASFWIAILAAKICSVPLMLTSDATSLAPRDRQEWKLPVKRFLLPRIFGLADAVCALSSEGVYFFHSLGVAVTRVVLTHYTVDNDRFAAAAAEVDRSIVRKSWDIPDEAAVVLFCAKLTEWKRPGDLLRAFAQVNLPSAYLVLAGDGPLRARLAREAEDLGMSERVRFLGFVNQARLPEVYAASDVLVLPSEHEPWGLVVNEAMVCGLPAIVSDRVGARLDLVREGETGWVFPTGDISALASLLERSLSDRAQLRRMGGLARARMSTWSYREHIASFGAAVERLACERRSSR